MITLDLLCTSLDSSGLSGVYFHIKTFYWDYADWDYRALGQTKPTKEGCQQSTRTASVWELPSGGQGGRRTCRQMAWTQVGLFASQPHASTGCHGPEESYPGSWAS